MFGWKKYLAAAGLVLVVISEVLFFMKHQKNSDGLGPVECLAQNEAEVTTIEYPDFGFDVMTAFVPNSPQACLCPGFPLVKLRGNGPINAWLQIIEADSAQENLRWFVDGMNASSPYYTEGPQLSDTPQWGGLGFYHSFFTYFKARAYPLQVGSDGSILLYPAIDWGFAANRFSLSLIGNAPQRSQNNGLMRKDLAKLAARYPEHTFQASKIGENWGTPTQFI